MPKLRRLRFWTNDFGSRVTMHFGYPDEFYSTLVLRKTRKQYDIRQLLQLARETRSLFRYGNMGAEMEEIVNKFNRNVEEKP